MSKPTKVERTNRVNTVYELLVDGASRAEIIKYTNTEEIAWSEVAGRSIITSMQQLNYLKQVIMRIGKYSEVKPNVVWLSYTVKLTRYRIIRQPWQCSRKSISCRGYIQLRT